jgi:hypothetical protein
LALITDSCWGRPYTHGATTVAPPEYNIKLCKTFTLGGDSSFRGAIGSAGSGPCDSVVWYLTRDQYEKWRDMVARVAPCVKDINLVTIYVRNVEVQGSEIIVRGPHTAPIKSNYFVGFHYLLESTCSEEGK